MKTGVVAAATLAHVPTLSRKEITPEFQQTLVEGERRFGEEVRTRLKPDLWVLASAHWVSTFNWFATAQARHEGRCVADEAPDLVPGLPYSYPGDPEFAAALVEEWKAQNVPAVRNDSPHYSWDYGTFVPLSHVDPKGEVAVVSLPSVLMSDHAECRRAGAAVHAVAKRLGRRVVFLASTALTHALVRGRENMPTPERQALDRRFMDLLKRAQLAELVTWFPEYSRGAAAEMGGRVLATLIGCLEALAADGAKFEATQYGGYAQSSGSGNVNICLKVA